MLFRSLERVANQVGGLDAERDWEKELSLREQQLLGLANILLSAPRFVVLDQAEMTLGPALLEKIMHLLSERSITCIHFGRAEGDRAVKRSEDLTGGVNFSFRLTRASYQAVLEYGVDGQWTWSIGEHAS